MRFIDKLKSQNCNAVPFEVVIAPKFRASTFGFEDTALKAVCKVLNITEEQIKSDSRIRELVDARRILARILRRGVKTITLRQIGQILGDRDHSSVLYLIKSCEDIIETDPEFSDKYTAVNNVIRRVPE